MIATRTQRAASLTAADRTFRSATLTDAAGALRTAPFTGAARLFRAAPSSSVARALRAALLAGAAAACHLATPHALYAQGEFAGTWSVVSSTVAPWVPVAERTAQKADLKVQGHTVTFNKKSITGIAVLSCANPNYEIKSVPFENLFEGALKKPASEAAALGFKAPVRTLMPGCDFEFHMRDANTALFALNNMLYTMTRKPAAPK